MKNRTDSVFRNTVSTVEEVGCEDPSGLRTQQLGPGGSCPAGSRAYTVAEEDRADRRRGDPNPEPQQLSADPLVSPSRVLPAEADDEVPDLGLDRWPAGASTPLYVRFS
jgi:hypothetical protein